MSQEETVKLLQNIVKRYNLDKDEHNIKNMWRSLGAIEAILVINNRLKVGADFDYKMITATERGFFFNKYQVIRQETYGEHLIRLATEFIDMILKFKTN